MHLLLTLFPQPSHVQEGVLVFLTQNFPDRKFSGKELKQEGRWRHYEISVENPLAIEEKKEIYEKLKRTSVRFYDTQNWIYEI